MLVELFNFFSDSFGPLRVFDYLSFRAIFATLTALLVSLILGPRFISKMKVIEKFYIPGDFHFNEDGNKLIADFFIKNFIYPLLLR